MAKRLSPEEKAQREQAKEAARAKQVKRHEHAAEVRAGAPARKERKEARHEHAVESKSASHQRKLDRQSKTLEKNREAITDTLERKGYTSEQIQEVLKKGDYKTIMADLKTTRQETAANRKTFLEERRTGTALQFEEKNIEGFGGSEPISSDQNPTYQGSSDVSQNGFTLENQIEIPSETPSSQYNDIATIIANNTDAAVANQADNTFQRGVVQSIQTGFVTCIIEADSSGTPKIPYVSGYAPVVGDAVLILSIQPTNGGYDKIIVGCLASNIWNSLSYNSPFSDWGSGFTPGQYFRDALGVIHLRGIIKVNATISDGAVIAALPTNFRPNFVGIFVTVTSDAFGEVRVDTSGNISVSKGANTSGTWYSLDGISFRNG